jgi:hypothetical protein
MRTTKALAASLLSLTLLVATACSDDDTPVTAGDDQDGDAGGIEPAPDGTGVEVPDRDPDLVGTITSVEPFVPVTEDCTPVDEVDPDAAVSSEDPPICTPEDNDITGTVLVEENPDDPNGGRKISFTLTSDTAITGETADGVKAGVLGDLAVGQTVDTWISGDACAESYPEQCGLAAIRVTG